MKDMLKMSEEFGQAYRVLTNWINQAAEVEGGLYRAETRLEDARNAILRSTEPKDLGSNEAAREAKLAYLCMKELLEVQEFEAQRIGVRAEVEKARLQVDLLRNQLRLMELAAGVRAA